MAKKHLSMTPQNVQSRVWRRLLQHGLHSSYTMQEVLELCHEPCDDQGFRAYFETRMDRLRNILTTNQSHFKYEPSQGTVSLSEHSVIVDNCLVEFVALKLRRPSSSLDIGRGFNQYERLLPRVMIHHMYLIYGGSLELFLKTHRDCFVFYNDRTNVKLAKGFKKKRMLASKENIKLVFFFLDLLLKMGATSGKPCPTSLMRMSYLQHMDAESSNFFKMRYGANLDLFLLLNCYYFQTTRTEGGKVYPKFARATQGYCLAVYLKRYLQSRKAISSSTSLSVDKLALEGKNCQLSEVRSSPMVQHQLIWFFAFLKQYPHIFNLTVPKRVFLEKVYRPWRDEWSTDVEVQAVRYFIELLRDTGSLCPRSICFDYVFHCIESAPPGCRGYLSEVFPGLDIMDFFRLHPETFDLSSLNCVSLKPLPMDRGTQFLQIEGLTDRPAEQLAVHYTARLLRHAPSLSPQVLMTCSKTAPHLIAAYCQKAASKGHLQLLLESARKLLGSEALKGKPAIDHTQMVTADALAGRCSSGSTFTSGGGLHQDPRSRPSRMGSRGRPSKQRKAAKAATEVVKRGATTTCPRASEGPAIRPVQQVPQGTELVQAEPKSMRENEEGAMTTCPQAFGGRAIRPDQQALLGTELVQAEPKLSRENEEGTTTTCPQAFGGPAIRAAQQALQGNEVVQVETSLPQENDEGATTTCPQAPEGPAIRPNQQALLGTELVQAGPKLSRENEDGTTTTCPQAFGSPTIRPVQQALQGNEVVQVESSLPQENEGTTTTCPLASAGPAIWPTQQMPQGNELAPEEPELPRDDETTTVVHAAPLGCVCL